jgi:hypothetical protein
MSRQLIEGFDYRIQKPLKLTRKQWREQLAAVVKIGGKRRVENGETFGHVWVGEKASRHLVIAFECDAILPQPGAQS